MFANFYFDPVPFKKNVLHPKRRQSTHSQLSLKLQHPKLFGDHPNVSRRKSLNPGYQVSFLIPKSESPRLDGQLLECRTQNLLSPKEIFLSPRR
ncbi:hypothetical protein CDAR_219141 [Caerostris darwini]|uniref:Uncharacterized protein n=1 Tax=Caerostris darwini TaxID=1538125 RepID=A0AAV4S5Z1_9ARAC|nr:hypothetical protein CDAR_219141 [Caerostris darwini]